MVGLMRRTILIKTVLSVNVGAINKLNNRGHH